MGFYVVFLSFLLLLNLAVGAKFRLGREQYGRKPPPPLSNPNATLPQAQWFTQLLDHYNNADLRTWKQRYFINDTFYKPGGPAFILIEGEGEADPVWMVEGHIMKLAQEFNAFAFELEHRFYGESHPLDDMSVKSLQYLSSEQALADLANFRTSMATKHNLTDTKWIVFGGSYPGALASWFMLKYPHLADGAVASSAPVLAAVNFPEYLGVVVDALNTTKSDCVTSIRQAVDQIDRLLLHETGWTILKKLFKFCGDIDGNNKLDTATLYEALAGNFEDIVQYNKDNRKKSKTANVTIDDLCGIMTDTTRGPSIDRYADVNSLILSKQNETCLDVKYTDMIKDYKNTSWVNETQPGGRQWLYQTCTEFGFYQTSDLPTQPFGGKFPLSYFIQQCMDVFGPKYNQTMVESSVQSTNINYGGRTNKVRKVIYPNGSVDPWHYLGVVKDLNPEAKALFINGTAHCADMYPESPDDPPQLKAARDVIKQTIAQWIKL